MEGYRDSRASKPVSLTTAAAALVLAVLVAGPTAWAADVPFTGEVAVAEARVHAGAGQRYYVVGKLKQGERVQVEEVLFGWFKVKPPKGAASYVSKAFVDAQGDGRSGQVNRDRTPVMSASLAGPGDSYRRQLDLTKGTTVTILAAEGSFYKIASPDGAYVYLPPGSVTPASSAPPAPKPKPAQAAPAAPAQPVAVATPKPAPTPVAAPAAQPVAQPAAATPASPAPTGAQFVGPRRPASLKQPAPVAASPAATEPAPAAAQPQPKAAPAVAAAQQPAPAEPITAAAPAKAAATQQTEPSVQPATVTAAPAATTDAAPDAQAEAFEVAEAATPAVRMAEQRLKVIMQVPLEDRPIEPVLTTYEALSEIDNLPIGDQRIVAIRIAQLQRSLKARVALKELGQVRQQIADAKAAADKQRAEAQDANVAYSAVGRMIASSVYNGKALPRLFRIVEPNTFRTVAYVRPGNPRDAAFLGRVVGVVGGAQYDPAVQLRVVEAKRIDVLEPVSSAGFEDDQP